MKETVSPEGYSRDPSVKILNIRAGQRTWANSAGTDTGWNYDNRQVTLSLQKQSGEPELTQDHSCYSLAGAVYGVYRSREEGASGPEPDGYPADRRGRKFQPGIPGRRNLLYQGGHGLPGIHDMQRKLR